LPRPPSASIFRLPTRSDLLPTRELPVDRGFDDDESGLGSGTGSDVGNWGTGVRDRDFDRICIPAALIAPGGTSVVCVAAVSLRCDTGTGKPVIMCHGYVQVWVRV
jgi:hypothetical protein